MNKDKLIPIGKPCYYINKSGHEWKVAYGIVKGYFRNEVWIECLQLLDTRLVNGVSINELKFPTKWHKLPKNWDRFDLIQITNSPLPEEFRIFDYREPECITSAYNQGILVKRMSREFYPDIEINEQKGWRIVKRYSNEIHPSEITLVIDCVYETNEEAEKVVSAHYAELERQAALSDYDWSVEQIDHELNRWAEMNAVPDDTKEKYRNRILSMERVEDIEIRQFGGEIQWKYWKNKRWLTIEF
jgi:hypothetical protein